MVVSNLGDAERGRAVGDRILRWYVMLINFWLHLNTFLCHPLPPTPTRKHMSWKVVKPHSWVEYAINELGHKHVGHVCDNSHVKAFLPSGRRKTPSHSYTTFRCWALQHLFGRWHFFTILSRRRRMGSVGWTVMSEANICGGVLNYHWTVTVCPHCTKGGKFRRTNLQMVQTCSNIGRIWHLQLVQVIGLHQQHQSL